MPPAVGTFALSRHFEFNCGTGPDAQRRRAAVVPTIRYVAFPHVEADECGAPNDFLAAAPGAVPVCGQVAAMVSVHDLADRPARALADGEVLRTGRHALRWFDAPHVPHGWECAAS